MRVTNAGSCATILWSCAAVLLGSSTVDTIRAVTSGSVAIVVTFFTASATSTLGSVDFASTAFTGAAAAAGLLGTTGAIVALGIRKTPVLMELSFRDGDDLTASRARPIKAAIN